MYTYDLNHKKCTIYIFFSRGKLRLYVYIKQFIYIFFYIYFSLCGALGHITFYVFSINIRILIF